MGTVMARSRRGPTSRAMARPSILLGWLKAMARDPSNPRRARRTPSRPWRATRRASESAAGSARRPDLQRDAGDSLALGRRPSELAQVGLHHERPAPLHRVTTD